MAVFKCKMCGGNLEIQEGMSVCECEYCGSKQTVPNLDDEKKINLFSRANRLRQANEFDKASGIYESIIIDFPEESEAYWGLLLCKYGIEYVDDPKTGKKIPTCHRSSFDSIMDDTNFDMVMECSDPVSRAVYRSEAKAIEELRIGIIEVSSKEEPYDIFICYKETDFMGERTVDSVIAQDVYDALTEKGYKVFFSRISLEDKLGQEYEPYIFAALNSARVMLAFGTDYEYFNAVWVKNEWGRFLNLIEKGAKKTLIPCYKGIDAYDMPKEFARLQAQDMGKVGAIQDLLRGINKILGTKRFPAYGMNTVVNAETSALTLRGNMALEDGDFKKADEYFERALDSNPADARAYLGKFLSTYGFSSLTDLSDKVCDIENNKDFKRAEQFAEPTLLKDLKLARETNDLKIRRLQLGDVIRKIAEKKALDESMQLLSQCTNESYTAAIALFNELKKSKCIDVSKYNKYKNTAWAQFTALKYLKQKLKVYPREIIFENYPSTGMARAYQILALESLVKSGFLEKHSNGYCWPNAKQERERRQREEEERRQKNMRKRAAFEEACAKINVQIQKEISVEIALIDKEFEPELLRIQRIISDALNEREKQHESVEHHISELLSQQSTLGFFKIKEKKALQEKIDELQSFLNQVPSEKDIQEKYQSEIEQINKKRGEVIKKMEEEIRHRYSMPNIEDFAEV